MQCRLPEQFKDTILLRYLAEIGKMFEDKAVPYHGGVLGIDTSLVLPPIEIVR